MYFNDEVLNKESFGSDSITYESKILRTQINVDTPSYHFAPIHSQLLSDETGLFQFGNADETYLNGPQTDEEFVVFDSAWNTFPTKDDPRAHYKYASVHIGLENKLTQTNRKTDSFLDWLGDVGGLLDGLHFIFGILISSF